MCAVVEVDKVRVLDAVERSVSRAPQIKRWLDWKGQPTVSVAVGLSPGAVAAGRLYNFLPMGDAADAPLLGHLDAPFFAAIDRRDADFDLPLNATLMKAAAEACAHAALYVAGQAGSQTPQRTVFDLVAWTGGHAGLLDAALDGMGSSLRDAPVVPTIAVDGARWAGLSGVSLWPAGAFSLMKAAEVARRTGARLVSTELDGGRLDRLRAMAKPRYLQLSPSGQRLAEWSERFASSLADRNAAARTWTRFYEDLNRVFGAADEKLDALAGRAIILDRSKKLRPAGHRRVRVDAERNADCRQRVEAWSPTLPDSLRSVRLLAGPLVRPRAAQSNGRRNTEPLQASRSRVSPLQLRAFNRQEDNVLRTCLESRQRVAATVPVRRRAEAIHTGRAIVLSTEPRPCPTRTAVDSVSTTARKGKLERQVCDGRAWAALPVPPAPGRAGGAAGTHRRALP